MELLELNKIIKEKFNGLGAINSIFNGEVYNEWSNNPSIQYSSFVYDVKSMVVNDNVVEYTYSFYVGDRMLEDGTNYNEVYEQNYKIIEKGLAELYKDDRILGIGSNRNYTFVRQRFSDVLAVAFVDVTISVANDVDLCN